MVDEKRFLKGRIRSGRWRPVSHGLFVPVTDDGEGRLHALASRLHSDGGFTHLTAARLLDWWLPPLPRGLPVFAAQSDERNRPRRDEMRMIRTTPAPEIWWLRGLPVVPPTDILLACARHLGLLDVVVLLDSALRSGYVRRADLALTLATRRFGVRRLRAAAALSDPRAESPFEILLRVLHVACEVLVEPQFELRGGGRVVARGDLRLVGYRTFHEYDGATHRDRDQHRRDLRRDRDLEEAGWIRRGYTDQDVLQRPVGILRDIDRTLGRLHDPCRLDAWYALLRDSCFTGSGQQRLLERLGLVDRLQQRAA
jgi:hypothetical protein